MKEKTDRIIDAIGENTPEDYILAPKIHAEIYRKSLPKLSLILSNPKIKYIAEEYCAADQKAIKAQAKFKKLSSLSRLFLFLTATFSTTLLVSGSVSGIDYITQNLDWLPNLLLISSSVSAIIFGAISTVILRIIKTGRLLEKWMEFRSEAEEFRINYFKEIALNKDLKTPLDYLIALEYFRRYQLDIQLNFLSIKAGELEKKSNKSLNIIAVLSAIVLVINGFTGILGFQWTSLASLAAIAIIIQNYVFLINNKELNEQNTRNAERYRRTRTILAKLKSQISEVREAILQGNVKFLTEYIYAVNEPISSENRQWLKTMKASGLAIEELERHLENFKEKSENKEISFPDQSLKAIK